MQSIKHKRLQNINVYEILRNSFCKNSFLYYMDDIHSQFCNIKPFFCYTNYFEREVGTYIVMPIQDAPVIIAQSGRERENVE